VIQKDNIHQKFAVIDYRVVWYGSINFLSYGKSEESVMRVENSNVYSRGREKPHNSLEVVQNLFALVISANFTVFLACRP
jgi:phosphatidylserine/phosphatidylglycerophosphate/cardiolipin synthase-like enzyme